VNSGTHRGRNPSGDDIRRHDASENDIRVIYVSAGQRPFGAGNKSAPSRIRTCAHGSGGRHRDLAIFCDLPARTQSASSSMAETIPRIFRII
jgi:hypothetical protein